jgi:formate dehydrogenase major subunit
VSAINDQSWAEAYTQRTYQQMKTRLRDAALQ